MAMVENSGMVLGMGGDMAHHTNLNVDWYHTPSPSPSSQFSASVAANQAPPPQIHSSNSNGLPFHPIPDNIAHHPKKSAQNEPLEKPEAESVKKAVVPVSVPAPVELDSVGRKNGGGGGESMRELEDQFSKLNPLAQEFVPPPKQAAVAMPPPAASSSPDLTALAKTCRFHLVKSSSKLRPADIVLIFLSLAKKGNSNQGKRRINSRILKAQREESVQRTVYVSDIDQQVTEEQLAGLFIGCGQVVDCRICGDPNSVLRFAFVEFTDEEGARTALSLAGTMLGFYPLRVLPSKTAIVPVNPTFLPRSEIEREMCARTVYCTNIDKKVSQADVKLFFETLCGEVSRLRMLGDFHHSTRIAFVEFVLANSAMLALNCSGVVLGSLPIRVSPSKTPVRACGPRPQSR